MKLMIGLTGPAGAGKDTVGEILETFYGYERYALASPIKKMLAAIGFDELTYSDRELKEEVIPWLGVSYRHLAQTLGTEWGRSIHQHFWLQLAQKRWNETLASVTNPGLVITDVRFENEAALVRTCGFLIHIEGRQADLGEAKSHSSEAGVARVVGDFYIDNNGSIDDLRIKVAKVMEEMYAGFGDLCRRA